MLKEVTRYIGIDTPGYGTATPQEAIDGERAALRRQRLMDTGLFREGKEGIKTTYVSIDTVVGKFDDIKAALDAADAQFEADNKAFLKKHRPAGDAS